MLDIVLSVLLVAFVLGFVVFGIRFLRTKKRERIEQLTELLSEQEVKPTLTPLSPDQREKELMTLAPQGWVGRIGQLLSGKKDFDAQLLSELEATLVMADVGVTTTQKLLTALKEKAGQQGAIELLRQEILDIFAKVPSTGLANGVHPAVYMIVGVNGAGKTTSIGKIASQLKARGKRVLMAAGDTYRAAAKEQLAVWADRTEAKLVAPTNEGADPASVAFEAVKTAREENFDVVLCDTAGRLHTKTNLMEELKKVHRVLGKAMEGAPHEVLLVIDATMGQNALMQAKEFAQSTPLTGIVLTKLDGTAKGGIAIAVASELKVPIKYIGVGERAQDLRPFEANEFVDALFRTQP